MDIKQDEISDFLKSLNGKFFTVTFIKRKTGEVRVMTATTNYQSHLAGGEPAYDFAEKKLLPVWDLGKQAFRSIPLDSITLIKANKQTYEVK